jgi:hypothetical protein
MSDHVHLEKGRDPWLPSDESELKQVYHRFTVPLVGLVVQHGVPYVFWCVVGHAGPESAWAYARLDTASDAAVLESCDRNEFERALTTLVKDRACTFALSSDETGILESVDIDPPASFDDAFQRGMHELQIKIKETQAEMESLMVRYESIQSVRTFDIAPSPALL